MSQEKPKDMLSQLGMDVELSSEALENNPRQNAMLNELGAMTVVPGCKYVGSVGIHYYLDEKALLKMRYEMCSVTQIAFKEDISENLAALGFNNAYIEIRKHFNPKFKYKTLRKGDKR